jgi:hypothetical protein
VKSKSSEQSGGQMNTPTSSKDTKDSENTKDPLR